MSKLWQLHVHVHAGDLIGFTRMGDVADQLQRLDSEEASTLPPELLANTMMTFMVKGLCKKIEFPYAYFPSRKVKGYMLFDPLWEAVIRLEGYGFKVNCTFITIFPLKKLSVLNNHDEFFGFNAFLLHVQYYM